LGFITNHGYLDNPTFRGMRRQLLAAFPAITVIDLHGNTRKKERLAGQPLDQNVFDIGQGVAIGLFRRPPGPVPTSVQHADVWGSRAQKYELLARRTEAAIGLTPVRPSAPYYSFVPGQDSHRAEYEAGWRITDVMPVHVAGIVTARDSFV